MGCALFVVGPAGCGKTTLVQVLHERYASEKRNVSIVNLDPAQILEDLPFAIDIRNHIDITEIMEEADFGPNGGMMAGLEAVADNIDVLGLPEEENAFLIFDCPGQIELYIHSNSVKKICDWAARSHSTAMVYTLDATHVLDASKFVSGALSAIIAMAKFELPHINVLTKCDMVSEGEIEEFMHDVDMETLCDKLPSTNAKTKRFNQAFSSIIETNGLLSFHPLDYAKDELLEELIYQIDTCVQYFDNFEGTGAKE
ncbi:GPN-loop GTPase [Nematocida sp. AWRm77]|nr:GPN-loop GTPase [Nematocida sp. AWRm77]